MTRALSLFCAFFLLSGVFVYGQTLTRTVISSGGGTSAANNYVIAFNIGEPVADLLVNTSNAKILTTGFIQADQELRDIRNNLAQQLVVYPNPTTTGLVKLDFGDLPDGAYLIDIVDAAGHVLYTRNVTYSKTNSMNLDLDISYFMGGIYFIRVKNDKNQGRTKLVKL